MFLTKAVLGEQTYEPFGRTGESMTDPEVVTYAYDRNDRREEMRGDLNAVSIDHD